MSVTLAIAGLCIAQGWSGYNTYLGLTNSGDESAKQIMLKVIDTSIFSTLKIGRTGGAGTNCLNVYTIYPIRNYTDGNESFPAGTTKLVNFTDITIEGDAPIQDNPLKCYWQYICY